MRDERVAVWDGWEISEMGEKFLWWSFREERATGEREGRVRRAQKNERDEREITVNKENKILLFFYNLVNSTILCIELYCSSIAK